MEQDRFAGLFDDFVDRPELRLVERRPVHIGGELDGIGAVPKHPLGFADCRLRHIHRQQGRVAGELAGMPGDDLGKAVVGEAGHFRGFFRPKQPIERRQAMREDLGIVLELVDDPQPAIEIEHRGNPAHAFAQILRRRRAFQERIEIAPRKEMIVGIDNAHGGSLAARRRSRDCYKTL
jgi:hypothetical protein